MMGEDSEEVQAEPVDNKDNTNTQQTSPSEIVTEVKAWSYVAKSFLYVEVSSLVLMFASIGIWDKYYSDQNGNIYYNNNYVAYALSVACVSLLMCLIIQTWEFVKPGILAKTEKPVSLFLFFWWAIGTGILTFKAPFAIVGNGYFSAWAGLAFTTHWALNIDVSKFTELDRVRKAIFCMGIASAVTFFACIPPIIAKNFVGQSAWGLSAGLITVIVCAVLFKVFDEVSNQLLKVTTIIMFIMWATVAGVCTFDGPFLSASNGYFGCWAGFLISTYLLNHVMTREREEDEMV